MERAAAIEHLSVSLQRIDFVIKSRLNSIRRHGEFIRAMARKHSQLRGGGRERPSCMQPTHAGDDILLHLIVRQCCRTAIQHFMQPWHSSWLDSIDTRKSREVMG